jgi:hypothetical protein
MRYLRRLFILLALVGAVGFGAVSEARAATRSAASKRFYSLVSGNRGSIRATQVPGGGSFRQEIQAELRANRINFVTTVNALRQDFTSGLLSRSEFLFERASALFNFQVTRRSLVLTLRFGRPPLSPGF